MMHWESFWLGVIAGTIFTALALSVAILRYVNRVVEMSDQLPPEDLSPSVPFSEKKRRGKTMWDNVHRRNQRGGT
jgi:hypothetical protein